MATEEKIAHSCAQGHTVKDLVEAWGEERFTEFYHWWWGQTGAICDGQKFNSETNEYEPSTCHPNIHGQVFYSHDVEKFVNGLPVID